MRANGCNLSAGTSPGTSDSNMRPNAPNCSAAHAIQEAVRQDAPGGLRQVNYNALLPGC